MIPNSALSTERQKSNRCVCLAFTEKGKNLAQKINQLLEGEVFFNREIPEFSLNSWTGRAFEEYDAIVFVGALGIAVRGIAPFAKSKLHDPAVLVVDEGGNFVIPVLSGHIGGANKMALEIAGFLGATPVITTATDVRGVFAVDTWAAERNLIIKNPKQIKRVSGKVLSGDKVRIFSEIEIDGMIPEELILTDDPKEADIILGNRVYEGIKDSLILIPRRLVLGIGCRAGISLKNLESRFLRMIEEKEIHPEGIGMAASIERKAGEAGLLQFCRQRGFEVCFFSAPELSALPGEFTSSERVKRVVGVDNLCERSAVCAGGRDLIVKKYAGEGITFALGAKELKIHWQEK